MASGNNLDPNHQGPAVNFTLWLCFILSTLLILAKIYTKLRCQKTAARFHSLGLDDALLSFALLLSLAYSIVISKAIDAAFGNHLSEIKPELIIVYERQFSCLYCICIGLLYHFLSDDL